MNSPHTAPLFNALRALSQIVDIHSRSLFKKTGVTAPQLSILVALAETSPLHVSELSKRVHLSIGTISGTITRMEKNGLIERKQHIEDKRKAFFSLTDQGRQIVENGSSLLPSNFITTFESDVPEWERTMILSALQRLIHLMQTKDPVGTEKEALI